jgi:hypothetical protein
MAMPRAKSLMTNRHGYATAALIGDDGRQRPVTVHRLVLEAFVGPCQPGMVCRHFPDPNRKNNALANLSWGTHAENCADRNTHGTAIVGARHHRCRALLTELNVLQVRALAVFDVSVEELCRRFSVRRHVIEHALRKKTWKHLTSLHEVA